MCSLAFTCTSIFFFIQHFFFPTQLNWIVFLVSNSQFYNFVIMFLLHYSTIFIFLFSCFLLEEWEWKYNEDALVCCSTFSDLFKMWRGKSFFFFFFFHFYSCLTMKSKSLCFLYNFMKRRRGRKKNFYFIRWKIFTGFFLFLFRNEMHKKRERKALAYSFVQS